MRPVVEAMLPDIAAAVAARIMAGMVGPDIRPSRLGAMDCAIGAAAIAHHHALDASP